MDIWCANGGSYYDGGEIAPKVVSGSSRLYLLLVSTTTFLGPLFTLASTSSGWYIDSQVIPQGFNPKGLHDISAIPIPLGHDKLPAGYTEAYVGPHFNDLTSEVYTLVTIAYVLSLLANATFPMKMLGPWRIRTSCFPMFIYLFQGIFILAALLIFHTFKLPDLPASRIIFSTSYYSAVISCSLSFISAFFLGIDFIVLSRLFQNRKGVGCSPTMMVLASCLVIPSLWCHFGAFAYHLIEHWPPILGFYFSLATITTIGFGDFRTETHEGRTFLFFHTLIGIILMVGLATSVKSAFKNVFRSGRAERIRRKSLSVQANTNIDHSKNAFGSRQFALDLGTLRTHFLIAGLNFLLLWAIGAAIFMFLERWTYFDALYFSFVTFSTIGYGDIVLKSYPGLLAFACYSVYGMVAMSYFISVVAEGWVQKFAFRSNKIDAKWWDKLNRTPPTWTGLGLSSATANLESSPESHEELKPSRYALFLKRKPQSRPEAPLERFEL